MTNGLAIEAIGLTKKFGDVSAVNDLSFTVNRGEMFAFVGPDGAGKTTTIRMLCGILAPDAGSGTLLGFDIKTQSEEVKKHIGYLSQKFSLYTDLSIDENIEFFARIHNVENFAKKREELLEFTRLKEFRTRLADKLSGGMKQKLALACTLIHKPEIIFLDEPTTGVDPVTRRDFWKLLAELMKDGTTIFLTTPYLDEAERCTRVALLNKGKILASDTPAAVRAMLGQKILEVICSSVREAFRVAGSDAEMRAFFTDIQLFGERIDFIFTKGTAAEAEALITKKFSEHGFTSGEVRAKASSLENVFIQLMQSDDAQAAEAAAKAEVETEGAAKTETKSKTKERAK
ncbi:MAG: ABC transporter ATP-binding protein [Rhizobacter sp.]|nr:ABC transporter ATP-binding protein [Chlorobiales bacterium]